MAEPSGGSIVVLGIVLGGEYGFVGCWIDVGYGWIMEDIIDVAAVVVVVVVVVVALLK